MEAPNSFIQLIDGDGILQKKKLEDFINESSQFSSCGLSYHVVSIMGPQSSGKSTLLNSLFNSEFQVMNDANGRTQTTRGIWIAKSIRPCMAIIDTEGSDGNERGLDDTRFEKQSALFTLMISDIIILNMWYKDVGRANGSGLPLLEIIFQERMRLQDKHPPRSRKRLLVILRDSPSKNHKAVLATMDQIIKDIKKVWNSVRLGVEKNIALADYFELKAFPLPDYENCRDDFDTKVTELRGQLSVPAATDDRFPIGGLSQGIGEIWKTIQNNANLDLPSIKESVSQNKCREIAKTIIQSFESREDYKKLSKALDSASLPNFRAEMEHLLKSRLQEYHTESHLYDVKNSAELVENLKSKLFEIMKCLYEKNIWQISNDELTLFKNCTTRSKEIDTKMKSSLEEFEKKCAECAIPNAGWSCIQVKQSLEHKMKDHQLEIYAKELESQDKCREIVKRIIQSFKSREDYKKLSKALDGASLPNFRKEMEHLLESRLQEYHTESHLYDVKNSAELVENLKSKLFEIMKCLYEKNIWQISNDELTLFKNCTIRSKEIDTKMKSSLEEFEKKCAECAIPNAGWSCIQVKQSLEHKMKDHQLEIYAKELESQDKCREIVKRIIQSFKSREDYKKLSKALDGASLPNFREEMEHLLESRLQEYHTESHLYDVKISAVLVEDLKSKLFEIMKCLYEKNIQQISNEELTLFKNCTTRSKEIDTKMKSSLEEFEKKCAECAIPNAGWSCIQVKQSLEHKMKEHQLEIYKVEAAKTGNARVALKAASLVVKAGLTVLEIGTGLPLSSLWPS